MNWREGIELRGFWMPRPMASNGAMSICLGNAFSSGLKVTGVITRITLMPSRVIRVLVKNSHTGKVAALAFTGDGTYGEVDDTQYSEVD